MESQMEKGLVAEILAKHGQSAAPESRQIVAVLQAVSEVIRAEGLPVSPTSLFAAIMAALDKPETRSSEEVVLAMCSLLAYVLPRVPNSILRSKFAGSSGLVCAVLEGHRSGGPIAKAALGCLPSLLAAMEPSLAAWPLALPPFHALLAHLTDARPKVRKRAQGGLAEVLAALAGSPVAASASELVMKVCHKVLTGPEAAAHAAAAATKGGRSAAEEALAGAVADALHLLGALKASGPLLAAPALKGLVQLLLGLYPLRQPLLSRHATDVLAALVASSASALPAPLLAELLAVVLDVPEGAWGQQRDASALLSLTRLLEAGFQRLGGLDPGLAGRKLPKAFHALVPLLAAELDGVRYGASQALQALLRGCVDKSIVAAALSSSSAAAGGSAAAAPRGGPLPAMQSIVAALASSLAPRYRDSWPLALPVVSTCIQVLAEAGGARLAEPLVVALGALCAGAADAADDAGAAGDLGSAPGAPPLPAADAAMGVALRHCGPWLVLTWLPLNLKEWLEGKGPVGPAGAAAEPRTWLLPLMRKHVRGTTLAPWAKTLLPLARALGARAVAASKAGASATASACLTLELQIWHTLPAFCSWASDAASAYPAIVQDLGAVAAAREDLRLPICLALQRLCHQARRVLKQAGAGPELIGYSDPPGSSSSSAAGGGEGQHDHDEDDEERGGRPHAAAALAGGDSDDGPAPSGYTSEVAAAQVAALRKYSRNWLPLLFKTFLEQPPEARRLLGDTIAAYAAITDAATLAGLFRSLVVKLIKVMEPGGGDGEVITEGGSDPVSQQAAFMELATCLAAGLDAGALGTLYKAAKPGLASRQGCLQKKAYRVLAYICEARPAFMAAQLQDLLACVLAGSSSVSAAKRHRLRCLGPLIQALGQPGRLTAQQLAQLETAMMGGSSSSNGGNHGASSSEAEMRSQLVSGLVGEIVLCVKEANAKTRILAYQLLVDVAHAMDAAQPEEEGGAAGQQGETMEAEGAGSALGTGGLHSLFTMVMGGLAGATPHMVACSVMALARLVHEFPHRLEAVAQQLLPAVLLLCRSRSREVVKAVLGFVKVCAGRLPPGVLAPQLGRMMEALLLWAEDSKNRFKLKVRLIVERLARRCGYEALAGAMPAGDQRLLGHIRKEAARKEKKKLAASQAGSEAGGERGDGRSRLGGRTAGGGSEWGHTNIFGSEEDEEAGGGQARSAAGARAGVGRGRPGSVAGSRMPGGRGKAAGGRAGGLSEAADEPLNLLDASTSRQLVRSAAGRGGRRRDDMEEDGAGPAFPTDLGSGKLVIRDEGPHLMDEDFMVPTKRKSRDAFGGVDDDDEDDDDVAADRRTLGGVSRGLTAGGKSAGGKSGGAASRKSSQGGQGGASGHSGDRFKARKGAGGDTKGKSAVEPYAYWQFDRKMLNRRRGKQAGASKSLKSVVSAVQAGAAKGAASKRRRVG